MNFQKKLNIFLKILTQFSPLWIFLTTNQAKFIAFVGVFTNKSDKNLLVKTRTKAMTQHFFDIQC